MGAWTFRTNGLVCLRLIRRWLTCAHLFGALGASLVWAWCGCGCGCVLGARAVDACARMCDSCVCVCLGVGANL